MGKVPDEIPSLTLNGATLLSMEEVTLLGVTIDRNLTFLNHINKLCNKATRHFYALRRLTKYLNVKQIEALTNSYIKSLFTYCPLVWMFCKKTDNDKINKVHERCLRLITKDYQSGYAELLTKTGQVDIHKINLRCLMTEIFKTLSEKTPQFMKDIFTLKETTYNLRRSALVRVTPAKTASFGAKLLGHRGSLIWNSLDKELRNCETLGAFKHRLKYWDGSGCHCKICRFV